MAIKNGILLLLFLGFVNNCFSINLVLTKNNFEKNNPTLKTKPAQKLTFVFGTETKFKKGIAIDSPLGYQSKTGYGFDFNSAQNVSLFSNSFGVQKSAYFSIQLPEGNYQIKLVLNSEKQESKMTVKAESRRVMLAEAPVKKGKQITQIFNVNVRTPKIDDNSSISLKEREFGTLNWDDKLSLEFIGTATIEKIEIIPLSTVTNVFLAGDSTVTDQDLEPWGSWGQFITQYFDTAVVVSNYAVSGAALSSFKSSGRLKKIQSLLQAGDYLIIEFGHNDEKIKGEENGPWHSYSDYLTEFIQVAKSKGAIPILVTPTQRRFFNKDGTLKPTHGEFPDAMRAVAQKNQVLLIDITQMTTELYEAWGDEPSRKAFVQYPANTFPGQTNALEDNTHFNSFGANEIARCVVEGIKKTNSSLKNRLLNTVAPYSTKQPNIFANWTLPMSSRFEAVKPDGN